MTGSFVVGGANCRRHGPDDVRVGVGAPRFFVPVLDNGNVVEAVRIEMTAQRRYHVRRVHIGHEAEIDFRARLGWQDGL